MNQSWLVPLSDVSADDELLSAVQEAVASGWWSMGPRVAEFEASFGELCGTRHAFAVANGTAALHLALLACECGPGDEVVLPSLNFVAAANVVAHSGARPVFCDIRGERDLNLDPDDLEAAVGPATKAVIVLHYGGHPCDMDRVLDVAERHGLAVIEDAAHAPGASLRRPPVRLARARRLLQLLLQQEPADRRGRHGRHGRRRCSPSDSASCARTG